MYSFTQLWAGLVMYIFFYLNYLYSKGDFEHNSSMRYCNLVVVVVPFALLLAEEKSGVWQPGVGWGKHHSLLFPHNPLK